MSFQDLIIDQLSKTTISDCFRYSVDGDKILVYSLDGLLLGDFYLTNDDGDETWYFEQNSNIVMSDIDDRLLDKVWIILNKM